MVNLSPWRFAFQYSLIIFSVNFKVGLRMNAGGTQLRCLGTDDNVTAVTALPNLDFALLEDLGSLHILQQCTVALLMVLLNGSNQAELCSQLV